MNRASVVLLCLVALTVASLSHAQPVIWKRTTHETSFAQLIRDTSSNLYFVTRTSSFQRSKLNVTKYNAAGAEQWTASVSNFGSVDEQFNIRSLALTNTHVVVVAHVRQGGGFGSFVRSAVFSFNRADGAIGGTVLSSTANIEAVAGNAAECAILLRDIASGVGSVSFLNPSTLSAISTLSLGVVNQIGSLAMDTSGYAYAAYTVAGAGVLTKCSNSGGIAFDVELNSPNHGNEVAEQVVVDPVGQRAYVMSTGTWSISPFDLDVMLSAVNTSTGALSGPTSALATNTDDYTGGLLALPNAGVITSAYTTSSNTTSVRRYSKDAAFVWENVIASSGGGYRRAQALDVDGNVLALLPAPGANIKLARLSITNGIALGELLVPQTGSAVPMQIVTDSAGAAYVNHYDNAGSHLSRIQHADMSVTNNLLIGGLGTTLRITAASVVATDQTWTLSSSNTNVVTVPATATISAGNSFVETYPVTSAVAANTNVSINARNGGLVLQKTLTVLAPQLFLIQATPNSLIGGNNFLLSLTLTGAAPSGGRVITLSSNKPAVVALPASHTIPAGITGVGLSRGTFAVSTNQGVVLSATLGSVTKTVFMAVNAPSLTNLTVTPGSVKGGSNSTLNLTINGIAPTGGLSIVLISGAPGIVLLPGTASVAAGLTMRSLSFQTTPVTSTVNVTLFATRAGIYRTTTLTVTP